MGILILIKKRKIFKDKWVYPFMICKHFFVNLYYKKRYGDKKRGWFKAPKVMCNKCFEVSGYTQKNKENDEIPVEIKQEVEQKISEVLKE